MDHWAKCIVLLVILGSSIAIPVPPVRELTYQSRPKTKIDATPRPYVWTGGPISNELSSLGLDREGGSTRTIGCSIDEQSADGQLIVNNPAGYPVDSNGRYIPTYTNKMGEEETDSTKKSPLQRQLQILSEEDEDTQSSAAEGQLFWEDVADDEQNNIMGKLLSTLTTDTHANPGQATPSRSPSEIGEPMKKPTKKAPTPSRVFGDDPYDTPVIQSLRYHLRKPLYFGGRRISQNDDPETMLRVMEDNVRPIPETSTRNELHTTIRSTSRGSLPNFSAGLRGVISRLPKGGEASTDEFTKTGEFDSSAMVERNIRDVPSLAFMTPYAY